MDDYDKNYMNAWIDPSGSIFRIHREGHRYFADNHFMEKAIEAREVTGGEEDSVKSLCKLGWMRVMTWNKGTTYIIPENKKWGRKMTDALFDLCMEFNYEFPNEILDR